MSSSSLPSSNVNDVLARMKASGQLQYDLPDDDGAPVVAPTQPGEKIVSMQPAPATQPSAHAGHAHGHDSNSHDDADVQEYLNRLLKRSASSQAGPAPKAASAAPVAQPAAIPVEQVPQTLNEEDYVPKSVAPEKKSNLNALREVANHSNRTAIETSVKRQHKTRTMTYLAISLATLGFGALFLFMSVKPFDASMIASFGSFAITLVPILKLVQSLRANK